MVRPEVTQSRPERHGNFRESAKNIGKDVNSRFFMKSKKNNINVFKTDDANGSEDIQSKCKDVRKSQKVESGVKSTKLPFDKKTYHLKKYSKKYKLQQWENSRKKAVLREYFRETKKDVQKYVSKIYGNPINQNSDDEISNPPLTNSKSNNNQEQNTSNGNKIKEKKSFKKSEEEFKRSKKEKINQREEFLKVKAEKEMALKKYQKEKAIKFKRLSRKTKKGQPVMKDRIEMLLEKIQKSLL